MELNSGNLRSQCEAVIAVLQGSMSSEGGTSAGGVTGYVTGGVTSSKSGRYLSAKSHECYRT